MVTVPSISWCVEIRAEARVADPFQRQVVQREREQRQRQRLLLRPPVADRFGAVAGHHGDEVSGEVLEMR